MATRELPSPERPDRIERRSRGALAAAYLRRLIFDGDLRPGDRVPQEQVARRLGVSRIPVREGLITLESEGWVTIELHRGAFIAALDEDAVRDHYELFGMTYGLAAKRATQRSGPALARQLAALRADMGRTDDAAEVSRLTIAFHAAVVSAANSPRIKALLQSMSGMIPGNFFEMVPGSIAVERKGAAAVVRAVKQGDGDAAALEYLHTMRRQADRVIPVLAARGLFADAQAPPPAGATTESGPRVET